MRTIGLIGSIIWVGIIAFLGNHVVSPYPEIICDKEEKRYSVAYSIFAILPILLWAGFRQGQGYVDTNGYIRFYTQLPTGLRNIMNYIREVYDEDPGFTFFSGLIKSIFGNAYTPYLFIIASIQCCIVTLFFRKYSDDFSISLFLFIASTECFSWIFNGVRQFLAVVITLAGFKYLLSRQYVKYVLVILVASSIHLSALMMIPVAFIVQGRPWNIKTILTILITIAALVFTNQFTRILDTAMQGTQYSESVASWNDDGANPIRVLFYSIPTILAFIARHELEEKDNPVINISINMSIVSTALWLVAMVTSGIYVGRLPIYASLYNYVLLPFLFKEYFENRGLAGFAKFSTVIVYLAYYYYQVHITWRAV